MEEKHFSPEQVPDANPSPKKKLSKIFLFILIPLLFIGIAYYLIFPLNLLEKLGSVDSNSTNEQGEEEEEDNSSTLLVDFEGEYISTEIPEGWSIVEYEDGEGTNMLTPGIEYTGLTGLKIFKNTTEIFYMQAVSGLGFSGCPFYAKFEDESTSYYQQILENNEVSGDTVTVTNYTNTEYEEFTWLGVPFRRIAKVYVYDIIPGNSYFESACVPSLVSFYDLTLYRLGEGPGSSVYDYGAKESATGEDLLVVDQILQDMVLNLDPVN